MKKFIYTIAGLACLLGVGNAQEKSVIRLNSTLQPYSAGQPWNKGEAVNRRALITYLGDGKLITTAEMVVNASYLELETVEGNTRIPAKVEAIDYEANLALLIPTKSEDVKKLDNLLEASSIREFSKIGNKVTVMQVEASGVPLKTEGIIRGGKVISSFVPGHFFLTYEIKASMQSAASSFSIPVFEEGSLLGVLTSYNSNEQLLDVIAPEVIRAFLKDTEDGEYAGFPEIGLNLSSTQDPNFRAWLKLKDTDGGLYVNGVNPKGPGAEAGLKKGDVILAANGKAIDRQGYYKSERYDKLHWRHLVRVKHVIGEKLSLEILREGERQTVEVTLNAIPEGIIPAHMHDRAPAYLVKGGLIFQELSESYLRVFGDQWQSRAPLNLLDVYHHPEDYEEGLNRVVFISAVIPTPATLGYERLRSLIVKKVNGKEISDIKSLHAAFKHAENGIHKIEIDEDPKEIYLSEKLSNTVDKSLLQRGIPALSRYK